MENEDKLIWEGNSKVMFDRMLTTAPSFMREKIQKKFDEWVAAKGLTTLTESDIEDHVKDTVPSQFRRMVLAQLVSLKS